MENIEQTNKQMSTSYIDVAPEEIQYDDAQGLTDVLKAWELDPHFSGRTRAIPMADYISISELSHSDAVENVETKFRDQKLQPFDFHDSYSTSTGHSDDASPQSEHSSCPERPFHLKPTHLRLRVPNSHDDADAVVHLIQQCLESFHEFDFSFVSSSMIWKGKYLQGCSSCVIRIHLYCELPSSIHGDGSDFHYIVESCRIQGDSKPFYDFFKEFRHKLASFGGCVIVSRESSTGNLTYASGEDDFPSPDFVSEDHFTSGLSSSASHPQLHTSQPFSKKPTLPSSVSSPAFPAAPSSSSLSSVSSIHSVFTPCASTFLPAVASPSPRVTTGEEFIASLTPIITMVNSPMYETQLEAARMLWDVANHQESTLLGEPCTVDCLSTLLEKLIVDTTFHRVREQAIVTLARFVDIPGYAARIVTGCSPGLWAILVSYVKNPSDEDRAYDSAQLRRECAFILATLITCDANRALNRLLSMCPLKASANHHTTPTECCGALAQSDIVACLEAYRTPTPRLPEPPAESDAPSLHSHLGSTSIAAVEKWIRSFDSLRDPRLKTQAGRIRDGLRRALKASPSMPIVVDHANVPVYPRIPSHIAIK